MSDEPKTTVTSLTIRLRDEETGKITSLTWNMRGWDVKWQENAGWFVPPYVIGQDPRKASDGSQSLHIQAHKPVDRKKVARAMREAVKGK
jgi:hypothetical protein